MKRKEIVSEGVFGRIEDIILVRGGLYSRSILDYCEFSNGAKHYSG